MLDETKPSIREIKENKIGYKYSIPEEDIIKLDISEELADEWQKITNNISIIFNVPVALIMKVNPPKIEVFISSKTEGNPYHVGESEHLPDLYCNTVMIRDEKLLVPNALNDECWKDNPDVKLDMISYLGYPIAWPNNQMFGTICVLDSKENPYSVELNEILESYKNILEGYLENIYNKHLLENELIKSKDLEERLKERSKISEEKFRKIFEYAADGFTLTETDGTIIDVNESNLEKYGYDKDEYIGKNIREIIPYTDPAILEKSIAEVQSHKYTSYETIAQKKDGTQFNVEVTAVLIKLEDRNVIFTINRDITKRIQAESIQREAYSQLDKNIQEFAFLIDRIRNPLTIIQGSIDTKIHNFEFLIEQQIDTISLITEQLSKRWIESEKFRNILQKQLLEEV